MITMLTAYTFEAEDAEYAFNEIIEQLQLKTKQKKYSAGLLFCHPDFIENGVAQKISASLPFDIIGSTFVANMINGEDNAHILSVSLFTSDDIQFAIMKANNLEEKESIARSYTEAIAGHTEQPSLIMAWFPMLMAVGVDDLLTEFDKVTDGVPIFGGLACDHTSDYSLWQLIINGEISREHAVAIILFGKLQPKFYVANMAEKHIVRQKSVVTKAIGNVVMEINGNPMTTYLENMGFPKGIGAEYLGCVPFLINLNDDTNRVARGVTAITSEGYGTFSGLVPEGSQISVGSIEYGDILRMTQEVVDAVLAWGIKGGMLMHPCASHFLIMGMEAQDQKDIISQLNKTGLPYTVAYPGGEICPIYDDKGNMKNRYHNFTIIVCAFD